MKILGNKQYYSFDNYPRNRKYNPERDGYFVHDYAVDKIYFVEALTPKEAAAYYLGTSVVRVPKSQADMADVGLSTFLDDEPSNFYRAIDSRPDPLAEVPTLSDEELLDKYVSARCGSGGVGPISSREVADALRSEILNRMQH